MSIAMLLLCTTLYCTPELADTQSNFQSLNSGPQGVLVAAKLKCKSLNKPQCRKRKKCEWVGRANMCLPK